MRPHLKRAPSALTTRLACRAGLPHGAARFSQMCWCPESTRAALEAHERGDFAGAGRLFDAMAAQDARRMAECT